MRNFLIKLLGGVAHDEHIHELEHLWDVNRDLRQLMKNGLIVAKKTPSFQDILDDRKIQQLENTIKVLEKLIAKREDIFPTGRD